MKVERWMGDRNVGVRWFGGGGRNLNPINGVSTEPKAIVWSGRGSVSSVLRGAQ